MCTTRAANARLWFTARAFEVKMVPGLSGHVRSVSFESRKYPGMYIHRCEDNFLCMDWKVTAQDFLYNASFIERYAMDGSGGRSYQSVNADERFIGTSGLARSNAKHIRMVKPRYIPFEPTSMKDYYLVSRNNLVFLKSYSDDDSFKTSASFFPVAAFDGSKTYSFESALLRTQYLCVEKWIRRSGYVESLSVFYETDLIR